MSTTFRLIGTLLLCGLLSGCETKVEVKGPTPPPAPTPSATPKAPEAPVLTMPKLDGPKIDGPKLSPPAAGPSILPPDLPAAIGNAPTPSSPAANPDKRKLADDLTVVQASIAAVMKLKAADVEPTKTLAQLKVTNLDMADIREQIETRLKISLPMATLQKAAGTDMPYEVVDKLTVAKLAEVVNGQ